MPISPSGTLLASPDIEGNEARRKTDVPRIAGGVGTSTDLAKGPSNLTGERPGVRGRTDKAHSETAEHPFWDQDTNGRVRMGDLEAVTRLRQLNREAAESVAAQVGTWFVVAIGAVAVAGSRIAPVQ
jgi:hypothetical protein